MMTKKFCLMCLIAVFALMPCLASVSPAAPPVAADREKQVKELVSSAVKLINSKGEAAFAELNVKNGPWHKGETAIFVNSETGVEMVNAAQPELVGKNIWNLKGPNGKMTVQEQWKLVKSKGKGWVDGLWVKPGTNKTVPNRAFVQGVKIKGKQFMVGAAYYLQ
jgi:cytochrome c